MLFARLRRYDRLLAAIGGHVGNRPASDDRTLVVMRYRSSGSLTGEIQLTELAGVLAEARSALPVDS